MSIYDSKKYQGKNILTRCINTQPHREVRRIGFACDPSIGLGTGDIDRKSVLKHAGKG